MALPAVFLSDDRFCPISLYDAYKKPSFAKVQIYDNCMERVERIKEELERLTGYDVIAPAGVIAHNCSFFTFAAHFYIDVDYLDSYKDANGVMHNFARTGSALYAAYKETATRRTIHFSNIAKDTTIAAILKLMYFDDAGGLN